MKTQIIKCATAGALLLFVALGCTSARARVNSPFLVDSANPEWQNSNIHVRQGQHVVIRAAKDETWTIGWGARDANGYAHRADPDAGLPVFHAGAEDVDWHWGSLICAIGDTNEDLDDQNHQLEVGLYREFTARFDGYIYFLCNDNRDHPVGFSDNGGKIHVVVMVDNSSQAGPIEERVAPPAQQKHPAIPKHAVQDAHFVPTCDMAGNWTSDNSAEPMDTYRQGRHVVSISSNTGYERVFDGDYVSGQTIQGIQTRRNRAEGTTTRLHLTVTLLTPDSGRVDWIALDSNSDLRDGQTGTYMIRRVILNRLESPARSSKLPRSLPEW
jgi:hypothetical protein